MMSVFLGVLSASAARLAAHHASQRTAVDDQKVLLALLVDVSSPGQQHARDGVLDVVALSQPASSLFLRILQRTSSPILAIRCLSAPAAAAIECCCPSWCPAKPRTRFFALVYRFRGRLAGRDWQSFANAANLAEDPSKSLVCPGFPAPLSLAARPRSQCPS